MRGAADPGLEGTGCDSVRPPVEPVAPQSFERLAPLRAQKAVEGGRCGELDPRGTSFGVPLFDEGGHAWIWRTIVDSHRMSRLGIHKVEGIVGIGFERRDDGWKRVFHEAPVAEFGDAATPQIMEAIPGKHLVASWALPPESVRNWFRCVSAQRVDRHRHQLDAKLVQQIGIEPADTVDIALHGGGDVQPVLVTQALHRVETADHLLRVLHRSVVVLHAGHIDVASVVPPLEAIDLGRGCLCEVLLGHARDFAGPAVLRFFGKILGGFDQVERLVDELGMLPEAEILIVGEADIGVTVIDNVKCLDGLHVRAPSIATDERVVWACANRPGSVSAALTRGTVSGYGMNVNK